MPRMPSRFEKHEAELVFKSQTKPITLVFFGDVHWGAPNHAVSAFNKFCRWGRKQGKDTYYLFMGDATDFASATERATLYQGLHDSTEKQLDAMARGLIDRFAEKTSFVKGQIIGTIEGNHHYVFQRERDWIGRTSTEYLIDRWGDRVTDDKNKYLGVCGFVRLHLRRTGTILILDVLAHHGKATHAQTTGGQFNQVEQMTRIADANIYAMGHSHFRGALPDQRIKLESSSRGGLEVGSREIRYVRSGSFLKGYEPGEESYAVEKVYRPLALGCAKVALHWERSEKGGTDTSSIEMEGIA